jgi:hypothetical protein
MAAMRFFGHDPREMRMSETMLAALTNIRTAEDMIVAFRDEEQCRRLLESMVWSAGRVCPACGYKRSIAIAGRDAAPPEPTRLPKDGPRSPQHRKEAPCDRVRPSLGFEGAFQTIHYAIQNAQIANKHSAGHCNVNWRSISACDEWA